MMLLRSFLTLALPIGAVSANEFQSEAEDALRTLQSAYDPSTGLWKSYGDSWWHSGNALTTLANMVVLDSAYAEKIASTVFPNTLSVAPNHKPASQESGFADHFYDDDAWWALGWLRVYDATNDTKYLNVSETLFKQIAHGWPSNCSGLWWDTTRSQVNSIANVLFFELAASLANRVLAKKAYYINWANMEWDWFRRSGLYSTKEHYVLFGKIDLKTCKSTANGAIGATNAEGSLMAALTEMSEATGNQSFLQEANLIATACMANPNMTVNGILTEPGFNMAEPQADACQRKGAFMRGLMRLYQASPNSAYVDYAIKNAQSIWNADREAGTCLFGQDWSHFYNFTNACPQSSALDGLVAAWSLTREMVHNTTKRAHV